MEYPLGFHLVAPQAINEEHECVFHEFLVNVNQDGRLHKINGLALVFKSAIRSWGPPEPSKWSQPPFSAVRSSNGRIYARGAQDDKCIAIQYLKAIHNLKAKHFSPIRTIHMSYVPDEEIGGSDRAAKFVESKEFEDLNVGFVLDEGQASPGVEFRIFYADRTPWNVIIKSKGTPGHGSRLGT